MKKLLALVLLTPVAAFAADPTPQTAAPAVVPAPQVLASAEQPKRDSLFFSHNQVTAIMRANQGFIAPTAAFDQKNQSDKPADPGPRSIALAGILYHGDHDWTVWLNGQRITPKNVPDRIIGITVKPDHVYLRWMDIGNQRVVDITLHPHQTYLLDSDTIVAGT